VTMQSAKRDGEEPAIGPNGARRLADRLR
jgi:hypothetical protein